MSTGLIAVMGTAQIFTHTANADAKLKIIASSSTFVQSVKVNGVNIMNVAGTNSGIPSVTHDLFISAGQTILVETSSAAYAVISSYEG